MKILSFIVIILSGLASQSAYAANTLSECSGCSYSQRTGLAVSKSGNLPFSNHFIIDLENEHLYFYRVAQNEVTGSTTVSTMSVSSSIKDKVDEFFAARTSVQALLASDPDLLSDLIPSVPNAIKVATGMYAF